MASIKVKFKPSAATDREVTVYYQITHERKVRLLPAGYRIHAAERNVPPRAPHPARTEHDVRLSRIRQHIRQDLERLARIARSLDKRGVAYTVDDVVREFERYTREYSLAGYFETQIAALKNRNKTRTAETYRTALNSFRHFCDGRDIMLDALTAETVEAYEAYLQQKGNTRNTTSFYMRILRAVYNKAAENGIIEQQHPFRRVYTGIEKTVKRALTLAVLKKIRAINLTGSPRVGYARDMFMLSFYLRGMSFIDMAYLRKTDLRDGYISYRRRKTGQRLTIKWTKEMQAILEKYPQPATPYLLPIIIHPRHTERHTYRNRNYAINQSLKTLARMVGIQTPLTMYCARHSWASAARSKGVPIGVISEGMGHDSEATTRIYLAQLDTSQVDRANTLVIASTE